MSRVIPPALLVLAVAALLFAPSPAHAHRLEGEYKVQPKDRTVKVESWFETGDSPKNATVQVFRSDKRLLAEGQLNDDGVFVFPFKEPDTLRVVVSAPGGHRKELTIPRKELDAAADGKAPADSPKPSGEEATLAPGEEAGGRFADRGSRTTVKDVLIGIGLLLSLAGFVLGIRNARELRELRRSLK